MPEYNWWDDRTIEENDNMFCPIINNYCHVEDHSVCERECEEYKAFKDYYDREGKSNDS